MVSIFLKGKFYLNELIIQSYNEMQINAIKPHYNLQKKERRLKWKCKIQNKKLIPKMKISLIIRKVNSSVKDR
jgi:hypothetical protein